MAPPSAATAPDTPHPDPGSISPRPDTASTGTADVPRSVIKPAVHHVPTDRFTARRAPTAL